MQLRKKFLPYDENVANTTQNKCTSKRQLLSCIQVDTEMFIRVRTCDKKINQKQGI
jgi:hypothetical protein